MLLKETAKIIAAGKAHSHSELAKQLGVSEDMLAQLMRELEYRGYLKLPAADSHCAGQCKGCAFAPSCTSDQPQRVWQLTDKGLKMVQRTARHE